MCPQGDGTWGTLDGPFGFGTTILFFRSLQYPMRPSRKEIRYGRHSWRPGSWVLGAGRASLDLPAATISSASAHCVSPSTWNHILFIALLPLWMFTPDSPIVPSWPLAAVCSQCCLHRLTIHLEARNPGVPWASPGAEGMKVDAGGRRKS